MEAIVGVDFESVNELKAVLLAVELLLVGEVWLVDEVLLLSAVGELVVEL